MIPEPLDNLAAPEGYHSARVDVDVRLNVNESPFPPPAEWVDEVAAAVRTIEFNRYPDRSARELRGALANLHDVDAENVFVANGSNEVIQTLLLTYGGVGRRVAVFEPSYAMHSHIATTTGADVVVGERGQDFALDLTEVKRVLGAAAPAVTFVASPNNPTGRVEPRSVVDELLELAPGLLVVDEAYGQFSSWSAVDLLRSGRDLVVTRTFSKTWSMAAFRLGYLLGPAAVVEEMEKRVLPYHLDAVKQAAGALALRYRQEMEKRVAAIVAERERITDGLAPLPVDTWPSEANFVLFRPRDKTGTETWNGLVERSVLVRDCSNWPRLDGCLRVTVGTADENSRFLDALSEVLA